MAETRGAQARQGWLGTYAPHVSSSSTRACPVLYYGESLGATVVAELATEHPAAGPVLRSPFTDLASVGQIHYPLVPVRALLKDRFPIAEYLARVAVPITVVYGTEDSIVPPGKADGRSPPPVGRHALSR
jgi:uncharacterized protein